MALPTRLNNSNEVLAECDSFGFDTGTDTKLGDLSEGGITWVVETEENEVRSGSQREVYAFIRGATRQLWRGELLNVSVLNFAFALGENENTTNITGTGAVGDPYILSVNPDLFGQQAARTYFAMGTRVDGQIVRGEATARIFSPNLEVTITQGSPTAVPFLLRVSGAWQIQQWTP